MKIGSVVLTKRHLDAWLQFSDSAYDVLGVVVDIPYNDSLVAEFQLYSIEIQNCTRWADNSPTRILDFYPYELVYIGELE